MKEYKLKRWYPSLPSDWKHKETVVVVERDNGYELHPSHNNLTHEVLRTREVVDTEFWEELKPVSKDYEVLKLKAGENLFAKYRDFSGSTRWLRKDAPASEGTYFDLQVGGTYGAQKLEIYSVKRLSDGEIFKIGDEVVNLVNRRMKIVKLYPTDNGEVALKTDWTSSFTLNKIRKAPPALFTTEDAVEIFEGDEVYMVSTIGEGWQVHKSYGRPEIANPPIYFKYFSTKEKAEEFVLYNKPMFNIKEIRDILRGKFIIPVNSLFLSKAKEKTGI